MVAALVMALVIALIMGAVTQRPLSDPDTYLHLASGRWIVMNGEVPAVDVFSHSAAGRSWIAHEWLSQVILHGWYQAFGWSGLVFLGALIFGITLALVWVFVWRRLPWVYALTLLALSFFCLVTHFQVRPHVLAWPLLAGWTAHLIDRSEAGRAPSAAMLGVWVLWVNMHGSFALGLVILGFFTIQAILCQPDVRRGWLMFLVAALVGSLMNPAGWKLVLFAFELPMMASLAHLTEWAAPRFTGINPLALMVAFLLVMALSGRLRLAPVRWILLVLLFYQAMSHARYVSLFGLLAPLLVAKGFQLERPWSSGSSVGPRQRAFMGVTLMLACGVTAWLLVTKPYQPSSRITPSTAVDALIAQQVQGAGLHFFNQGAYLLYRGVPVFIDGRLDLYGNEHMRTYLDLVGASDPVAFEKRLTDLDISWSLFPRDAPINRFFRDNPQWSVLHEDPETVLFVRRRDRPVPGAVPALQ